MSSNLFEKKEIVGLGAGLCVVVSFVLGLSQIGALLAAKGAEAATTAPVPAPTAAPTSTPLYLWLGRLEQAESQGSGDRHLKILDVNDQYSYGCLQFQAATFLKFGKMYNVIPSTMTDVEPLIYNCDLQKQLAADMIRDDYGNWRQWYNSVTKEIGLPPR